MKNLFYVLALSVTVLFTSCSSDDMENEIMADDVILGTWEFVEYFLGETDLVPDHLCLKNSTITFMADNKAIYAASVLNDNETGCETETTTIIWEKVSKNTYSLDSFDETETIQLTLDTIQKVSYIEYIDSSDSFEDEVKITLRKK